MSLSTSDLRGRVLAGGRYVLGERLGAGAMGEVWSGEDRRLGRPVAMKLLLARTDADSARRFRDEARAAARVRHPALVEVFERGEDEELGPWIASELLPGPDLAARLARSGPLSEAQLRDELAPQLLGALGALHRGGVIHRDVKPSNVLLDGEGRYRLADFGLALFGGREARTATGVLVGTPAYMAPEQLGTRGGALGPEVDLFAAGLVMAESLTGRLPVEESALAGLLRERCTVELDEERLRGFGVPAPWAVVLAPVLRLDPGRRPAEAEELLRRIRGVGGGRSAATVAMQATRALSRPAGTDGPPEKAAGAAGGTARLAAPSSFGGRRPLLLLVAVTLVLLLGAAMGLRREATEPALRRRDGAGEAVEEGRGEDEWLRRLVADAPLHRRASLDALQRALDSLSAREPAAAVAVLRRWEEGLREGAGSDAPATTLVRNRRMEAEGVAETGRRIRPMMRACRLVVDEAVRRRGGSLGDEDWCAPALLLEQVSALVAGAVDGATRERIDADLDALYEALRTLAYPAFGDGQARRFERALARLHVASWRWAWPEGLPAEATAPLAKASSAADWGGEFDRIHGDQRRWSRKALDVFRDHRVAVGTMDAALIRASNDAFLGAVSRSIALWWPMQRMISQGLGAEIPSEGLVQHVAATREIALTMERSHLVGRPAFGAWRRPFVLTRLGAICHRGMMNLLARAFPGGPSPEDALDNRAHALGCIVRHLAMLREGDPASLRARWGELEAALGDGAHGGDERRACRACGLHAIGRLDEALDEGGAAHGAFLARLHEPGLSARRLVSLFRLFHETACFLMQRDLAPLRPGEARRRMTEIRAFVAGFRRRDELPEFREEAKRLLRACAEAEEAILVSLRER